jgi:hypothetical protein
VSAEALAKVAADQFGHLSREQALACGLTPRQIAWRVLNGTWERVFPRVYRVAAAEQVWPGRLVAAHLWAGPLAVFSHQSAGALLGLADFSKEAVELSGERILHPHPGIVLHRLRAPLSEADVALGTGLPVTSVERTLLDLSIDAEAGKFSERYLERAFDEALRDGLTRFDLLGFCRDENRKSGRSVKLFAELLEVRENHGVTDSPLESDFGYLVRKWQLPQPFRGHFIVDNLRLVAKVDFAWPDLQLCVQTHGGALHREKKIWENDQIVESELSLRGWRLMKVTWQQMITRRGRDWLRREVTTALLGQAASAGSYP